MTFSLCASSVFLVTSMALFISPVGAAEPTEDMRTAARVFATLEAVNLKGYCDAMNGPPYVVYLTRVCRSAVQNRMKKPEDCSPDNITQQLKTDHGQCLTMPAAEFEKAVIRGAEGGKAFVKQTAAQGVDGEKLIREERAKLR